MRLLTRSDFDGLACGALLQYLGLIDEWKFVHPKDIQDGLVEATDNDILANIPYIDGCKLWFDHHSSESERLGQKAYFEGVSKFAPSCARVIFEYYGGNSKLSKFEEMIHFVDKVDSGNLTPDEILDPKGWVLLGFMMDPRTGLGRFRNFSVSNYELMMILAKACGEKSIYEILQLSDVKERLDLYFQQTELFKVMVKEHTKLDGNVIYVDLRDVETIFAGNRFIIYTLYPEQNVSIWVVDGRNKSNVAITAGYSITNRTCSADIGSIMLIYGGGGHKQVGTCQVAYETADDTIAEIIKKLH